MNLSFSVFRWILLALAIAAGSFAVAQTTPSPAAVVVTARSSSNVVSVAERFEVRVDVTAPKGSLVSFADVEDSLGGCEVLDVVDFPDIPVSAKQSRWTRVISLETIKLENVTVPPIEVSVQRGVDGSMPEKFSTKAIPIEVRSVLEAEERNAPNEFRDIAGELPLPADVQRGRPVFLQTGAVIATVLGLGWGAFWLFTRFKNRPLRWCRRELASLKQHPITDSQSYLEAAVRLKQIIQVSLADSFTASSQSQSTSDLVATLHASKQVDQPIEDIPIVLRCTDRLKFSAGAANGYSVQDRDSLQRAMNEAEKWLASLERSGSTKRKSGEASV